MKGWCRPSPQDDWNLQGQVVVETGCLKISMPSSVLEGSLCAPEGEEFTMQMWAERVEI